MLRMCVLGSGSSGNCIYVGSERVSLLVDAGLSGRETARRLGEVGVGLDQIGAICLTHEHSDHIGGLVPLWRRRGCDLYANRATAEAASRDARLRGAVWKLFSTGSAFTIGDLTVHPFAVSHDALDPVGFVLEQGVSRVGIVTDIGVCTVSVRERLRQCQAVVLEANHDEDMLRDAARPWSLKQRISGRQGHLSNRAAAEMLIEISGDPLRAVFLAHISLECNTCVLAVDTVREALRGRGLDHVRVEPTYPDRISVLWP